MPRPGRRKFGATISGLKNKGINPNSTEFRRMQRAKSRKLDPLVLVLDAEKNVKLVPASIAIDGSAKGTLQRIPSKIISRITGNIGKPKNRSFALQKILNGKRKEIFTEAVANLMAEISKKQTPKRPHTTAEVARRQREIH